MDNARKRKRTILDCINCSLTLLGDSVSHWNNLFGELSGNGVGGWKGDGQTKGRNLYACAGGVKDATRSVASLARSVPLTQS